MSRDYRLYLRDIVAEAAFVEQQTASVTFEEFAADEVRLKAILLSLAVIGEAANHVPDTIRKQQPEIPWVVGVRNIIIHGYFALNLPIVWDIVTNEIPSLRRSIRVLLDSPTD
jgi:uncharacterized protein with HEPN domain